MKYLKIDIAEPARSVIRETVLKLKKSQVIALPTDTIYGFSALITKKEAIDKIYQIKQRDKKYALLILVNSLKMVKKYCQISTRQFNYLKTVWPGPVTVILDIKPGKLRNIFTSDNSIAVRWPDNEYLQKLIKKTKTPLISTSANITTKPVAQNGRDIINTWKNLENQPSLVIDGGNLDNKASRIIDLRDIDNIKTIRE